MWIFGEDISDNGIRQPVLKKQGIPLTGNYIFLTPAAADS